MSDDEYDFDEFPVDESFLQQVDDIATRAAASASSSGTARAEPAQQQGNTSNGNNTSHASHTRTIVPAARVATAAINPANPPFRPPRPANAASGAVSRAEPAAGPSRRAMALGVRLDRPVVVPSSDDFDDMGLDDAALAQIDEVATGAQASNGTSGTSGTSGGNWLSANANANASNGNRLPPRLPGTRSFGRTFSRSLSGGLQTHLNFRREAMYTKGKRWDRTAFAASGRRIDVERAKKKGRSRDDDDEEEFDDEDEDPFGLEPQPLVDMNKPYEPQRHHFNEATIKDYLYPTNHPKRDYQYEIIRACFTDNCLVALPTGLGKTFVAGVVMLNFYRWFPTGKIVFLAPTKPLVNQQIEACQLSCGIPSADAAVMTGASVSAKERERLWKERRVFYCTPQTLDNDLKRGAVDPRDIVLAVFDEAHKASGSYAYTTILAYITAHHPYFRVLALTATPGGDVPKVQGVVDALHISRIEIREAEAPEIRKYMNEKKTETHVVLMGSVIEELRDRWAAIMKPFIKNLVEKNVLTERDLDAKRLKPFRLTARRMEILRDRQSQSKWAIGALNQLEKMATAMRNLLEFSLGMFHTTLLEIAGHATAAGKKGNSRVGGNSVRNNIEFQRILGDVEAELNAIERKKDGKTATDRHPKMHTTLELLLAHFAQADEDEKVHGIKNDTRAMVFCSYRDCVLEIVDMLNDHPDLLRATKFVGQSQGKQERDKGFNQREQKKTIQEFKEGKYNVLVSTSIGEEGLDIGEVDFVVIYDMPKQSIKLLQRIGRTGRKRDGHVHVLMSEDREDRNWDKAQQTHREIQEEILHSRNLELFEDVERLLPPGEFPTCTEREMAIDPWDPAEMKKKKLLPAATQEQVAKSNGTKAKRVRGMEIPDFAHEGFKSVAELLKLGAAKQKKRGRKSALEDVLEDAADEVSEEEEEEEDVPDFDVREHEMLYGSTSSWKKSPATKPRAKKAKTTPTKTAKPKPPPKAKKKTKAELEEEERARQREELSRQAREFFATQSIVRARTPSPTPAVSLGVSKSDKSAPMFSPSPSPEKRSDRLSPRTAAAAGFSQVCVLSSDDDMDD